MFGDFPYFKYRQHRVINFGVGKTTFHLPQGLIYQFCCMRPDKLYSNYEGHFLDLPYEGSEVLTEQTYYPPTFFMNRKYHIPQNRSRSSDY